MLMPGRKRIRRLPALLPIQLLTGCAAQRPFQDLPAGGDDTGTGQTVIDDSWVNGPQDSRGTDAPLPLTMTNQSTSTDDALVAVSTRVCRAAPVTVLVTIGPLAASR